MSGDPNWLLSTAAQSAAAIVGLIGAFLINRLIAMASARASLERSVTSAENQLKQLRARDDDLKATLLRKDSWEFLERHMSEILRLRGEVALADIIQKDRVNQLSEEEIRPLFVEVTAIVKAAFVDLEEPVRNADDRALMDGGVMNFLDEGRRLSATQHSVYSLVFEHLLKQPEEDDDADSTPWLHRPLTYIRPPAFVAAERQVDAMERLAEEQDRRQIRRDREDLQFRMAAARIEMKRSQDELTALATPSGVWGAVGVLIYFAIVGVLLPMALIPLDENAFHTSATHPLLGRSLSGPTMRLLLYCLFLSGLLLVISYFVWAVKAAIANISLASVEEETGGRTPNDSAI